jgi:glutaredoxin 3
MKPIVIYTKFLCSYCHRAKALLKARGAKFEEHDISFDRERRAEMVARSNGRTTVPQIFIGDLHVGGSDELAVLDAEGRLESLLA